ncbi:hypothetical protein [Streptomyces guryensis]|uniref:hypothetical protein n=1 Tax=Streptomyces guryensis TaxID=2886947 RepID=UPI0027DF9CF7|nr:hypothetical protein [Streptomyces guryensis]
MDRAEFVAATRSVAALDAETRAAVEQLRGIPQEAVDRDAATAVREEALRTPGSVMTRVGDSHHQLGEYDKAYDGYLEAIALAEKTGSSRPHGRTLLRLGSLQLDLGRQRHRHGGGVDDPCRPAEVPEVRHRLISGGVVGMPSGGRFRRRERAITSC